MGVDQPHGLDHLEQREARFPAGTGQVAGGQVSATLRTRGDRVGTTVHVAYSPYPLAATPVAAG